MINKIHNESCLLTMARMPDDFIDLTVTSPPYDNLRTYDGNIAQWGEHIWKAVIQDLFRITKQGGVVVWVVGDATIKGDETGTSFKQALYFKEIGFNLHDTMIYEKNGQGAVGSNYCYWQNFEYMFVFSKGKLKTFNPIIDRENKIKEGIMSSNRRRADGSKDKTICLAKPFGKRFNIWKITNLTKTTNHPAPFPEKLAHDHIMSWSNEGDLVYDPFVGSGTTAKMANLNKRNFIGSEISKDYCDIAEKRIGDVISDKLNSQKDFVNESQNNIDG